MKTHFQVFFHGALRISIALPLILCVGVFAAPNEAILVDHGVSRCAVRVENKATDVERHAADELCRYLGKVTGATVIQGANAPAGLYPICLGTPDSCAAVSDAGMLKEVQSLADDGYLLKADNNGLLIAARRPLGVLFGTYALLEEHVGLRWFYPGTDGEYCPQQQTLKIAYFNDRENPAFLSRTLALHYAASTARVIDTWDWMVRNRMRIPVSPFVFDKYHSELSQRGAEIEFGGHVLSNMIPDTLFNSHPEYFALINGRRVKQLNAGGHFVAQPDTSNPAVIELSAQYILDFFKKFPNGTFVLNENDSGAWCECANCRALDPPEERKAGIVSTRFTIFRNEVAKRVWQIYPAAKIEILAYQNFQTPPTGVRPDPRFIVLLCDHGRCYRHSLAEMGCAVNQRYRDIFEGWARFGVQRGIYNYYDCYASYDKDAGMLCAPLEEIVAEDIRYMHRLGHTYWTLSTIPPDGDFNHSGGIYNIPQFKELWRANMRMHYLQAKLSWNPNMDTAALLKDMDEKFYGPAAAVMERYQALERRYWTETPGDFVYNSPYFLLGKSVALAEQIQRLSNLLDEAEKAAGGQQTILLRIAKDRELFNLGWRRARSQFIKRPKNDVHIARRTAPITIDGRLDEVDWRTATPVTGFVKQNGALAEVQTSVKLLYDDSYLYVGMEMAEPSIRTLVANARDRAGNIEGDDTVELFIDPEANGKHYFHLAVNPDAQFRITEWKTGTATAEAVQSTTDLRLATLLGNGNWTMEIRVPANLLGGPISDGGHWTMDVGRVRRAGNTPEVSTWSDGMFSQTESFRGVDFDGPLIRNGDFADIQVLDSVGLLNRFGAGWNFGNTPPQVPKYWELFYKGRGISKETVISADVFTGQHAMQVENGIVLSELTGSMQVGKKLRISCAARGQGLLQFNIWQYNLVNPETNERKSVGGMYVGKVNLTEDWKKYDFFCTFPAGSPQQAELAIQASEVAVLGEVTAVPVQ